LEKQLVVLETDDSSKVLESLGSIGMPGKIVGQRDTQDIEILYSLKNYFKVGQITIHKYEARLEINGFQNAINYVIPHFEKYP
jgi:hypothetical protein